MPNRLPPRPVEDWDESTRALLGETRARVADLEGRPRSGPLNILRTIAWHPTLLEPFLGFATALATRGVLSRRESELLALRTAANCRSDFEWGHHVVYARAAGLEEAEIRSLASGAAEREWSESDAALIQAADELHAGQDVSDDTWSALRGHFDEAQLVEIPFVVGQYTLLSMVARATGVPLEDGLTGLP